MNSIPVYYRGAVVVEAVVDDDDLDRLAAFHWTAHHWERRRQSYARRRGPEGYIPMHREVVGLAIGDPRHVHHRNGNTFDNRKGNLQIFAGNSEHGRHHARQARPQ